MCGEKYRILQIMEGLLGSPPHVRGKVYKSDKIKVIRGITPACAGKSDKIKVIRAYFGDHPRMCGEKSPYFVFSSSEKGSPPHVRGKD